jgi:hypothetical protein
MHAVRCVVNYFRAAIETDIRLRQGLTNSDELPTV